MGKGRIWVKKILVGMDKIWIKKILIDINIKISSLPYLPLTA
jgi:hypothetical protein